MAQETGGKLMRPNRKLIPVENFHPDEFKCRDGCGKDTHPVLILCVQAFIYILTVKRGRLIRCIVSGPARCDARNIVTYKGRNPDTYHKGLLKIDEGLDSFGAAVDCVFQEWLGRWVTIPKAEVAREAIVSLLFGGVGWQKYPEAYTFVHFDLGPVRQF